VWLVGCADQPHPKISFFRRLWRESGRVFHKASDFVKAVPFACILLPRQLGDVAVSVPPVQDLYKLDHAAVLGIHGALTQQQGTASRDL
jgi:hypothetical protein